MRYSSSKQLLSGFLASLWIILLLALLPHWILALLLIKWDTGLESSEVDLGVYR